MARLNDENYLAFPFCIKPDGAQTVGRGRHVREQIEQVLYTSPSERVFRPEFGAGVRRLVFEPNNQALREITRKRLVSALAEALAGEVDPKSLTIEINPNHENEQHPERLIIAIGYTLAAIGLSEQHRVMVE